MLFIGNSFREREYLYTHNNHQDDTVNREEIAEFIFQKIESKRPLREEDIEYVLWSVEQIHPEILSKLITAFSFKDIFYPTL